MGRKQQAQTERTRRHPSFPSRPTARRRGGSGSGEGRREKWKKGNGGGGAVGASHCDQRTNRWYIVFALAYHNLRRDHDAFISPCRCMSVCVRGRQRGGVSVTNWATLRLRSRLPAEGTCLELGVSRGNIKVDVFLPL